jgi:hypothetical protein
VAKTSDASSKSGSTRASPSSSSKPPSAVPDVLERGLRVALRSIPRVARSGSVEARENGSGLA